jgi:hypothetical protein
MPTGTAIGDDADIVKSSSFSQGLDGRHDVIVHGSPPDPWGNSYFLVNGRYLSTADVAMVVKANPHYKPGQPVRLVSCYGACGGRAYELAHLLGHRGVPVDVESRTGVVWFVRGGRMLKYQGEQVSQELLLELNHGGQPGHPE